MIVPILASVALLVLTGLAAPALRGRAVAAVAAGGAVVAGALGLVSAVLSSTMALRTPWNSGLGASLSVGLDPLTSFFLLPVFALTALASLYGVGYLGHGQRRERNGFTWLCSNLLCASMVMVLLARNAVLFLFAWEAMTLSSWLLVARDHENEEARRAGILYLVASQVGTAALLVLFLLLGEPGTAGGLDFSRMSAAGPGVASAVFVLALVGFGTKAGFVPLHIWLPEAHPAAPTHISALMSGVMIKTGIYGIVRVLTVLGAPEAWWGWTVLAVGMLSALLGILLALAQHDLKRLLAYSSVENMGVIAIGLGLGMLGASYGLPAVAVLGWAGALVHLLNHSVFKGLLFLGAGSVLHAIGTREIDRMGGLGRRMPFTATTFILGALAITGLPPLNGFVGEYLVFTGSLASASGPALGPVVAAAAVLVTLGLTGALAGACFTKAMGIVFLGEPRSPGAAQARESPRSMLVAVSILALLCVAGGLAGPALVGRLVPLVSVVSGVAPGEASAVVGRLAALPGITLGAVALLSIVLVLTLLRRALLARRPVGRGVTWDCGYAAPTPRMQYTASSYAQPILDMFRLVLRPFRRVPGLQDLFPVAGQFSSETRDVVTQRLLRPALARAGKLLTPFRRLQHGNLHLYVLYILVALVVLVIWAIW